MAGEEGITPLEFNELEAAQNDTDGVRWQRYNGKGRRSATKAF